MAILNILKASETMYHKRLTRYIHFKGRKKGVAISRQFCTGLTTSHSSQVIPWGQITLMGNFTPKKFSPANITNTISYSCKKHGSYNHSHALVYNNLFPLY